MKRLSEQISALVSESSLVEKRLRATQEQLQAAQQAALRMEQRRQAVTLDLEGKRKDREHLKSDLERLGMEREKARKEREATQSALEQEQERHWKIRLNLETLQRRNNSLDSEIAAIEHQLQATRAEREKKAGRLTHTRVQFATTQEKISGLTAARSQAERAIQEMASQAELKRSQIEDLARGHEVIQRQIGELEARLAGLKEAEAKLRTRADEERAGKQSLIQEITSLSDRKKALQRAREESMGKKHQADLHRAQAEIQRQQVANRLLQEYELYPSGVPASQIPKFADPAATNVEIQQLKRQLRGMGKVNLAAAEEYAGAKERYDFLKGQKDDLEAARDDLHRVIREIDGSTQTTFRETFEAVNQAFQEMFRELFGGGRTELVLTDPANLLESGIEVIARPPGKKLQNLALLSGGEKALSALALLFALLKVKPSPFCVLDEVDAPLDDANVVRFTTMLQKFAQRSQFVVITHNRGTMEMSDRLYGISMEEPGISQVLSVNLTDLVQAPEVDEDILLQRER